MPAITDINADLNACETYKKYKRNIARKKSVFSIKLEAYIPYFFLAVV